MTVLPLTPLRYRAPVLPTCTAALAVAAGAAAAALLLLQFVLAMAGASTHAVASDSMLPAFARGDLVVTKPLQQPQVGDMVTFRKYGQLVTHRIVATGRVPGTFETRGDANPGNDPWTISAVDITGRVVGVVPNVGHLQLMLGRPQGRAVFVVLVTLLVAAANWALPRALRIPARLLHPSSGHAIA